MLPVNQRVKLRGEGNTLFFPGRKLQGAADFFLFR